MQNKSQLWLFFIGLILSSCQTINRSNEELSLPPSMVIFSFDDGPNNHDDTTGRLLDVLKKYEIKAMFSLLGENAGANPDMVKRIYDEGHLIINHGYSGKWPCKMGEGKFRKTLALGEAAISAATSKELNPKLYRPHSGFYTSGNEKIYREAGYTMVPSSVRIYDASLSGEKKDKAVKQVIEKVEKQNGGIILLHDALNSHLRMEKELEKKPSGAYNRSWIPDAVEEIIIALIGKGFKLNNNLNYIVENLK